MSDPISASEAGDATTDVAVADAPVGDAAASDVAVEGDAAPGSPSDAAMRGDAVFDSSLPAVPQLDLPFAYTIQDNRVLIHTDGGDVYASIPPWGSHFLPSGGHLFDAKSNIRAYFTPDLSQLINADGGACHVGDSCQLPESIFAAKVPSYIAPVPAIVTAVQQDHPSGATYYPNNVQLSLRMTAGSYEFLIGHMGSIAPGLRDKVLQATCARGSCVDVATWQENGTGAATNLAIPVAAGEELGRPQVAAAPGTMPGYFYGSGLIWIPSLQMEFFLSSMGDTLCIFDAMDPVAKSALQATVDRDMLDPNSVRYGPSWFQASKWQWSAEAAICNGHSTFPIDFSSLYTNLGVWFRRSADGGPATEAVAFVRIGKGTKEYDPGLYSSPTVDSLMVRLRPSGGPTPFAFALPGLMPLAVDRLNGELLASDSSALLVRWRDVASMSQTVDIYQRAAFVLDPSGLMIRWGQAALTAVDAPVPAIGSADSCGTPSIDCYDHQPSGPF